MPANDSSTAVRQVEDTSNDLVQLLVTRPPVYYGEGPFDPPSSDDEEEREPDPNAQHEFEDDVETVSLLSSTPLTPGRAESGGLSISQMRSGTKKVSLDSVRQLPLDTFRTFLEALLCTNSWICSRRSRRIRRSHWDRCELYVFRTVIHVRGPETAYYGPYIQWHFLR